MDYTGQNDSGSTVFFTSGAGTNLENVNNLEPENNLDLSNNGAWNTSPKEDIDPRSLGRAAVMQPRGISSEEHAEYADQNYKPELGKIIELEMPPKNQESASGNSPEIAGVSHDIIALPDLGSLKEEKGRISPKTLRDTERAVKKFEEGTISPDKLDDAIWAGKRAYLKNSFGRDIAA